MYTQTATKEKYIDIGGLNIHYQTAGNNDPPLVLLHGVGESIIDWSWVMPGLATKHRILAVDLPGFGESEKPKRDYSLDFLTQFLADFLKSLEIEKAVLVGNSLGGIIALRLALSKPEQVAALVLVDSMGFSQFVNPILSNLTMPMYGDLAIAWCKTPLGATQRAWSRALLLFNQPVKVPTEWIAEQERLAKIPGFLEAALSSLRGQLNLFGQHQILIDSLPQLQMPTLIMWGVNDLVLPNNQAQNAVSLLQQGHLALIPNCGHIPQVERPELFITELNQFLNSI